MMAISPKEYRHHRKYYIEPKVTQLFNLLQCVSLPMDKFMEGDVDLRAMALTYKGLPTMPERYAIAAHTRMRVPMNVIGFIEKYLWYDFSTFVTRQFQMPWTLLCDPDQKVNVHFTTDLLRLLHDHRGLGASVIHEIGARAAEANRGTKIDRSLSDARSPREMYEKFVSEVVSEFDENWDYKLTRQTSSMSVIRLSPKKSVSDALSLRTPGSELLCTLKGGTGASFLRYLHQPDARVLHTKCLHRGDSACLYEFHYDNLKPRVQALHA